MSSIIILIYRIIYFELDIIIINFISEFLIDIIVNCSWVGGWLCIKQGYTVSRMSCVKWLPIDVGIS